MPKVGIFLNQHLPLSEVFVINQATAMQRYTPSIIACRQTHPSITHTLPAHILNKNSTLTERLSEELFKATGFSPELKKEVSKQNIIHAHFGPSGWLASHLTTHTHKPLVVTLHGFDVTKTNSTIKNDGLLFSVYRKNIEKLGARADKFICVSEYLRRKAIEFGLPEEKCDVLYSGIPLDTTFTIKPPAEKDGKPFRILAIGRLVQVKGHTKLIEALSEVEKQGHKIHLDIVGGGPLRAELEKQASQSLSSFKFWGAVPHQDLIPLMQSADLFCHSSIHAENGQEEAFGLVLVEAQWAGIPVIAFRSGGIAEAMQDGHTGILCPEGDIRAMKDAVCALINSPDKRLHMAIAGQEFVRTHFDNKTQAQKIETLYDTIRGQK